MEKMIGMCACNPFLRAAMIQDAVLEGARPRIPYDNRIFFVYRGNAVILLNGQEIAIQENSLIYLGVRDAYRFKGKIRAAVLNFDMTMQCCQRTTPLCPVPREDYDPGLLFDDTKVEGYGTAFVTEANEILKKELDDLIQLFINKSDFYDALCSAALKKLLTDIVISLQERKTANAVLAERVMRYIKDNAVTIGCDAELGKAFGYHPVYLAAICKRHFGKTLHTVILNEKLCTALRLLLYTDQSVDEIALRCGFSSRSYFCTAFKKHFGMPPLAWRKAHRISL